jgi:predicted secreted protein
MVEGNKVHFVQINQQFAIDLEAMSGAGYMWELTLHPAEIDLLNQEVVSISKEIGGPSTQRFTLVARQPGKYSLRFELKRKWEQKSVKTSDFEIDAQ